MSGSGSVRGYMEVHRGWPEHYSQRRGSSRKSRRWWVRWAVSPDQPSHPQEQGFSWAHSQGSPTGPVLTFLVPLSCCTRAFSTHAALLPWPTPPSLLPETQLLCSH